MSGELAASPGYAEETKLHREIRELAEAHATKEIRNLRRDNQRLRKNRAAREQRRGKPRNRRKR